MTLPRRVVFVTIIVAMTLVGGAWSLENGLARTPPMGWMAWQRFRCETNCSMYPDDCVSAANLLAMGQALVAKGFAAVGYTSVHVDDCYLAMSRNAQGQLWGDPVRFPDGLAAVGAALHAMNLQWAVYEDIGLLTCGGYPGCMGHLQQDAATFASWGADYLKLDGCYGSDLYYETAYPQMAGLLNATGRPIVYSCSWPAYLDDAGKAQWYPTIQKYCNLWRNWNDVADSWDSIASIIDYWGDNGAVLRKYAGPGSWNDPDMLIIGGFSLSEDESRVQMGMWAIFAAPLIMGNDVRFINEWQSRILLNAEVIAVDQDPLGIQGVRLTPKGTYEVWSRPLTGGEVAVALLNKCSTCGFAQYIDAPWSLLNITGGYRCRDLFNHRDLGVFNSSLSLRVNEHGIRLVRCTPAS